MSSLTPSVVDRKLNSMSSQQSESSAGPSLSDELSSSPATHGACRRSSGGSLMDELSESGPGNDVVVDNQGQPCPKNVHAYNRFHLLGPNEAVLQAH